MQYQEGLEACMVFESVPLKDNHVVSPNEIAVTALEHKTEEPRLYTRKNTFALSSFQLSSPDKNIIPAGHLGGSAG